MVSTNPQQRTRNRARLAQLLSAVAALACVACTGVITGYERGDDDDDPDPRVDAGFAPHVDGGDEPWADAAIQDPRAGQIIVEPGNPRWLAYRGGGPNFMCGPGDPEGFLYRGTRLGDGTRDGDQDALIAKLSGTGANGIYFQAIRSHGGDDATGTNNPFIDYDPAKGIDEDILDQWESWFTALEAAGVTMYFFFYDDSACVWGCSNEASVPGQEQLLIETLVNRFEHHKRLVWVVAEEYQESFSAARVGNIAAAIRAADDHDHVIAVHKLAGLDFDEFADHPALDQFAIQYNQSSAVALHDGVVSAFAQASGRYNLNMAETSDHGTGAAARQKNWAIAMGGAYVMVLGWDVASTAVTDLEDCGRLVRFMESTNFNTMAPRDDRLFAGTEYLLASEDSYILYASSLAGELGVRGIAAGTYDLAWFDTRTGNSVEEDSVTVAAGDRSWSRPAAIGTELALWIHPAQ